jgi:hypothetical protein
MPEYTVYGWVNARIHTRVTAADPEAAKRKAKANKDNWWFSDDPTKPKVPVHVWVESNE